VTAVSAPEVPPPAPSLAVRARDVLLSEWTKFWSVRSTYWTLLIAAVTALGGSILVAVANASTHGGGTPLNPVSSIFLSWLVYPEIAVGILGLLSFTAEYSSGQIRTTFAAVPQRLTVLAAKALVAGAVTLVAGELLVFIAFFATQAILSGHANAVSLSQPGVLRALVGGGCILSVATLLGLGLGAIIRHTAGSVAALPAVIYLPMLLAVLPSPWNYRIDRFAPVLAAIQVVSPHPSGHYFSPAVSFVVLIAWPAVALIVAGLLINRRDA
jgi:ABC-2 type transport system permease protein